MIEMIRRANRTHQPEDSIAVRVLVLAAVLTGTAAIAAQRAIGAPTLAILVLVFPFAYWVSYVRRGKDNWHIKIALTIGAIFALLRMLGQLGGIATLDEVRFPLADLFLWVQVLHSFDLPARKDLNFSLGSSLTLMAVAGSLSQDLWFGAFVVVYFLFALAALTMLHRSEVGEAVVTWARPPRGKVRERKARPSLRKIARAAVATALAGVVLFLVVPQPKGVRSFALPFSLGSGVGVFSSSGGITNPGFPGGNAGSRASGSAYYGFDDRMDLRVRGELSDEVVMRVRASAPAMWKGILFATYDGASWEGDPGEPTPLQGDAPFAYPAEFRSLGPRVDVTQTFYVETEQPNAIFAAGQPDRVWFDGSVNIDRLGALRTASTLTPGTVYSVLSSRGAATPQELRAASRGPSPIDLEPYLQLPSDLPPRVAELAEDITRGKTNAYDQVRAIERYLAANYRYDIHSPIPPEGRDAVDHFLFDTDVGFCEQFASATTVMLRTLGVPARVAAGYAVGRRNPFTGYYEVRSSDAHTWVEVWFPALGWYEFDPTFAIPPAKTELAELIPLVKLLRAAGERFADLFPGGVGGALRTALGAALAATVAVGAWIAWRRLRPRRVATAGAGAPEHWRGPITGAFRRLEETLAARGAGRAPPETAAELMGRASSLTRLPVASALRAFERERYAPRPPSPDEVSAAIGEIERLADAARSAGPRPRPPS